MEDKKENDLDNLIYTEFEMENNSFYERIISTAKKIIVDLKRVKKYSEIKRRRKVIARKDSTKLK